MLDAVFPLTEIDECETEIVPRLGHGRIDLQHLPIQFDRPAGIAHLPRRFAEQRHEFRLSGRARQSRLQLIACLLETAQVEVGLGQQQSRRQQVGIEIERLLKLCLHLADHLRLALGAMRDPQQQVRLGALGIDREDGVQLANALVEARRGSKQVRSNTSEPLFKRRGGGRRLWRPGRRAGRQHAEKESKAHVARDDPVQLAGHGRALWHYGAPSRAAATAPGRLGYVGGFTSIR